MRHLRRVPSVALLLLAGCSLFGGGSGGRRGQISSAPASSDAPETIALRLVNKCAHAVDVCYAGTCVAVDKKPRVVQATTGGMDEVFVSFKGARDGIFADRTFSTVEVDSGCARLERKLGR